MSPWKHYKNETGKSATYSHGMELGCRSTCTDEYVEWLENKYEELISLQKDKENKEETYFPVFNEEERKALGLK